MRKKLAAALTIAIFVLSTFAIVNPVQAHFTLGDLTGTYRYHANDFDPHVAGPIGYVWPGSGNNAYSGFPNTASSVLGPGYQSPYPGSNPPASGGGVGGAPSQSWYQLESDAYAPFGAVLTGSTGDLIFALNATCLPADWSVGSEGCDATGTHEIQSALHNNYGWDTWNILIPPEFTVKDASQIVSTLTNSYDNVWVGRLGPDDRYAPGWTLVMIITDSAINPGYNHQFLNFTNAAEWYYVRINGVTAPQIAGRYFFKMFLYSNLASGANQYGVGPTLASPGGASGGENPDVWVPPENWPVMLVKGEVDPAIVTGTLRYGGYNASLYGQPIGEAGLVTATMKTRLDPYTGQQRPDLPTVDAQGFLNATDNGHYEVEGLAPGIYDLYAQAAGYPQTLCASGIEVLKGQSLHFDCYLQPGPVIHGDVFTKHQFGDEPWPGNSTTGQYMKIELYSAATLSNIPDPSAGHPDSWSPLPCTAGGQELYYGRRAAGLCGDPRDASAIAFPWHEYNTTNGYSRDVNIAPGASFPTGSDGIAGPGAGIDSPLGVDNLLASDPQGVGPAQHWFVAGGTTTPFHFEFGVKGEYGAPKDLSGEVPQVYSTWINGLTAGRYYVRAWTFRYVQTALDGSTFQEYYFDVTPNEWAGDITLPIDLRLSSWVNKTVYFHVTSNTITTSPIVSGAGFIWGNLVGADGRVYAHNVTNLGYNDLYYSCAYDSNSNGRQDRNQKTFASYTSPSTGVYYVGSGEPGAPSLNCPNDLNFLNRAHYNADSLASGKAVIQFWGINDTWGGENAGIPSGTYTPNVATNGYYSPSPQELVSITLSGTPTSISDHLFLGPGFNVTVTSIDWERPRVSRPWVWAECQDAGAFGLANGNGNAAHSNAGKDSGCAGSEIDLGFYPVVNGTAGKIWDTIGDTSSYFYLPPSIPTTGLYQGSVDDAAHQCLAGTTLDTAANPLENDCTEMDGGGRNVIQGYSNSHHVFYGESARYAFVGGQTAGKNGFTTAPKLWLDSMFNQNRVVWPLHFGQGQYNLAAYTYGYIQDKDFSAYAQNGQVADMKINLLIGVNVTLDILFKKESIITPTNGNMSARVRLFNDQSQLVAEWMSSEGVYVTACNTVNNVNPGCTATAANGALVQTDPTVEPENPLYPFTDQAGLQAPASGLNAYNFVPGGTTLLHVLMAGLPQQPPAGKFLSNEYFSDPLQGGGGTFGDCDFNLYCYPATYAQYPFPNTGILGSPDYTGGWTAEADFVPWYANNTNTQQALTDGIDGGQLGTTGIQGVGPFPQYYPPVQGLLMGESYHIVPGTTAVSGISLTEDTATNTYISPPGSSFVGHSMAANHLGPYSQQGVWQIAGTHLSGEASAVFEVDLNGLISGNALAFTWSNEFRPLSWGLVNVVGASGASWNFYTYDGYYEMFLTPGTYKFTITAPGYTAQTYSVSVSPGQSGTGQNLYLEQSNIPVPEFSGIAVVAFSALAASLYLLRRRRK